MKTIAMALLVLFSQQLYAAGCTATIVKGSHTALNELEARSGAEEDTADICPSGKVTPIHLKCEKVDASRGVMGKPAVQCVQEVSCTICDDDLTRKYEAESRR